MEQVPGDVFDMYEKTKFDSIAANESIELAGIMARLVASIIDGIVLALVATLLLGILSQAGGGLALPLTQFVGLALPVVYHWYFWTRRAGQTPGKSAVGVRVIKADGSEISDTDAFIRAIGYHVSTLLCGLGFIWAIFDRNNQTWHDKLAGTYVVSADSPRNTVNIVR